MLDQQRILLGLIMWWRGDVLFFEYCIIFCISASIMQGEKQTSLASLQQKINQANLRINNMRRKSEQAKYQITKNREQISKIIMEKQALALSLIEQEHQNQRFKQENQERISILRKKNAEKRTKQQKEIQDILMAMYLVKAHDAEEVRRISVQHEEKLRQMSQSNIDVNKKQVRRAKSQEGRGKEIFWKNKLTMLHEQNQSDKRLKSQALQQKSRDLQLLLNKSQSEQQNLQTISKQAEKSKRKYIAAANLPIKHVADLIQQQIPTIRNNPELISSSRAMFKQVDPIQNSRMSYEPHMEFSSTAQASEQKLKIVLESLKKKQRKQNQ